MLKIEIDADNTQLTWTDANNVKSSKSVDLAEIVAALSSNVSQDYGLLPQGCRHLTQKGNFTRLALEVPSQVLTLAYNDQSVNTVSIPPALFLFTVAKKPEGFNVIYSKVFAMRNESVILSTDALFTYPLPNIYEDNRICWGNNASATKGLKSLAALGGLVRRFFSAPFNQDLFNTRCLNVEFPWGELDKKTEYLALNYFKYLSKNTFNKSWLKPIQDDNYNTVTKAIKSFQNGVEDER